ncbi:MAG: BREX system P-loop protein BrxC [Spirochaetales bacterium]|nr:BREX system P-loop protein BrxC [Spirochaetales bacterium]
MRLQHIYKSDINREINGVIKVAQNDEKSIEQELSEYIITRELRKHFNTFLTNYEKSLSYPTDKIGVWISGFFGSGKSHFLKILSYLLSNETVVGKKAVDYFYDKFDDPMMFALLERCANVPTDTILFNIDSKGPINKDKTAILRVFAKVFYEYRGFYGDDLKVARLEQFIESSGKMDAFKNKFEDLHGDSWEDSRAAFSFFEDVVVEALADTLGMSETAARNWFNGTETADISIEQLVKEIKDYIDSKDKDFRLLFMVDEVGQYIGADGSLMLNLQTIVEEIGSRCGGRVWVMVTSQEAIDSITKISGDDFSKILGRFNTRLSLSSSSVDEVIKKRILTKTENAANMLILSYNKNSAVLKNLFTFNDAVLDLKGYTSEYDFIETYPFVPYQFRLMQNVFAQIRKHGNSGKHLSGGERSMLSGFQEAAQAIQDKDENALVPFSLFYNTVHTFLESTIRRVIDRCQTAADNHDGIEQYDVSILKLLYLIRYVDDIKSNVDNITTLMVEDIRADKINMRKSIQESLDRLVSQNYVARNGDTYTFLTDDEQDIERDIRKMPVDSATIVQSIAQIIFGDLYISKKFKYGKYDFPYDQIIDDTTIGQLTGAVRLRILTVVSDLHTEGDERLLMRSRAGNEAILVLSDNPYFYDLDNAAKIRRYVKSRNVTQLPEAIQHIIRGKQQQASAYEKTAKEHIASAILEAKVYVSGEISDVKATTVKDKIEKVLSGLVESVYFKLGYITHNFDNDGELLQILSNQNKPLTFGCGDAEYNPEAVDEVDQFLELQGMKLLPTSMGDIQRRFSAIPYGWREIDIAAVICSLISIQKVALQYSGSMIQPTDSRILDYLRRKTEIDKTLVTRRTAIPDSLMRKSREFLKEYFNTMDLPSDEDNLIDYVLNRFTKERDTLQDLLDNQYVSGSYPDKSVVENGIKLCNGLLFQKKDNTALLTKMVDMSDDFLDLSEDMANVFAFFKNQKTIFDSAAELINQLSAEGDYIQAEKEAMEALAKIRTILGMSKPYRNIADLPDLIQKVQTAHGQLLALKKQDVYAEIQAAMGEIHQTAEPDQNSVVAKADDALAAKKKAAQDTTTLVQLDAMKIQIDSIRQQYLKALMVENNPQKKVATAYRSSLGYSIKLKNEEDVDQYVADIKEKLMGLLHGNDVLHII